MPSSFIDIGTLRGLGTVLVVVAFTCVCLWAYSGKRKSSFAAAANLPFADQTAAEQRALQASRSNNA
jgi:cytochrome c oxidase cbb3-type subunit IV